MKILYGIQGTGNGHLSRARAMSRHFTARNADVTYLFSGRPKDQFFEMEAFGDFETRRGLTFFVEEGRVSYLKTAMHNNPFSFIKEVSTLTLDDYDVILCDFEPVTAWAGKLRNKTVIGFGHQPAFQYNIPVAGSDPLAKTVMKYFAPANINIGLHWHHFDQKILPPIIHVEDNPDTTAIENRILVYLPFENHRSLPDLLTHFEDFEFYIYHPAHTELQDIKNIHIRPLSVEGFNQDLISSSAVICNAGFELPSECIQFGKKLLVKPVHRQMEQLSNAVALKQLGLGESTLELNSKIIGDWLYADTEKTNYRYPDVANALVDWILAGEWQDFTTLKDQLWEQTLA